MQLIVNNQKGERFNTVLELPKSPKALLAMEYKRSLWGFPFLSIPSGMTPMDWPSLYGTSPASSNIQMINVTEFYCLITHLSSNWGRSLTLSTEDHVPGFSRGIISSNFGVEKTCPSVWILGLELVDNYALPPFSEP